MEVLLGEIYPEALANGWRASTLLFTATRSLPPIKFSRSRDQRVSPYGERGGGGSEPGEQQSQGLLLRAVFAPQPIKT